MSIGRNTNNVRIFDHCIGARILPKVPYRNDNWIPLPKCASNTLKRNTIRMGEYVYNEGPYTLDEKLEFNIIIRDPWKRFISGLNHGLMKHGWLWHRERKIPAFPEEAYYSDPISTYLKIDYIYESVFETGKFKTKGLSVPFDCLTAQYPLVIDEHTVPFSLYLALFRYNKIEMLEVDDNLTEELKEKLGRDRIIIENVKKGRYQLYDEFIEYFTKKLQANREWMDAWRELYAEDIWIYKNKKLRRYELYEQYLKANFPIKCIQDLTL